MHSEMKFPQTKDARKSLNQLSDIQASTLLSLLAEDNGFRAKFEEDPIAALSLIGVYPEKGSYNFCMTVKSLASKDELSASKAHLYSYLTSSSAFQNPHYFESGQVSKKLLKASN
jgi:putative modified peptide